VLQGWKLRPMTIQQACIYPRFECGMCGAEWVLTDRISEVRMYISFVAPERDGLYTLLLSAGTAFPFPAPTSALSYKRFHARG